MPKKNLKSSPPRPRTTRRSQRARKVVAVEKTAAVSAREPAAPSFDAIRDRAYAIFERRGRTHGDDLADWLQAERELQDESTGVSR